MTPDTTPRWVYRTRTLARAHERLAQASALAAQRALSDLEAEGLVQRFEYTLELAWKAMKDYLQAQGTELDEITPRRVVRAATAAGLVADGQVWIDAIVARNELSHTYDEARFRDALAEIRTRYLPAMGALLAWLQARADEAARG